MKSSLLDVRRLRSIAPTLGVVFAFCGITMLIPGGIAVAIGGRDLPAFAISAAIALVVGLALFVPFARHNEPIRQREAVLVVVLSWLGVAVLGALPFVLTGILSPIDALFESVSGFTTTGASVVSAIEELPAGLLFWRSLTHFLGGLGILVLAIAILPLLGSAGYQLFKTEAPALDEERMYPRMIQTARASFSIYVLLTVVLSALLMLGGLPLFDALAHAFGTIATGGFSTRNTSVGAYESFYVEAVLTLFMLLGSIPFGVHYRALRSWRAYLESTQVRYHVAILAIACISVALDLWWRGIYVSLAESARQGTFQVTSIMTTTGFATADFERWTSFTQLVLITVMFIGGCTGSTAGAIKTFRFVVLAKVVFRQLHLLLYPRAVRPIRVGPHVVDERVVEAAGVFFVSYMVATALGAFGLVLYGADGLTAISAAATTIGGVGPGLGEVGPYDNFSALPGGAKLVCIALMLLGRLEISTLSVVFLPEFWRL